MEIIKMGATIKFEIDYDKVYDSKYGKYKIIEEVKNHNYSGRMVIIRFEETGYQYQLPLKAARIGNVKDPTYIPVKEFNHPIHGPYVILEKHIDPTRPKSAVCTVKFLNTGTIKECLYFNALNMEVKDPYNKIKYGVACIGEPKIEFTSRMYATWHNMVVRCYDPTNKQYYAYGGSGVTVCERWLCFEYYLDDVFNLPNGEHAFEDGWNLDKDILQYNSDCKIYSPDTCMWIQSYINTAIANKPNIPLDDMIFGVRPYGDDKFYTHIAVGNTTTTAGIFGSQVAAANAYNRKVLELMNDGRGVCRVLNQVPYMSAYQILLYKHKEPMPDPNMCIIVDKNK
jgi:hypothetical protein